MRAIHCTAYGEPRDLVFVNLPEPTPGLGEVLKRGALRRQGNLPIADDSKWRRAVVSCTVRQKS